MTQDSLSMIGRRVECDNFFGTVKFVGEIPGTAVGVWLGVEWDDPSRGKHDGSHHGVRYFDTRKPTSGSFVRPHKVNTGRLCSEAIIEQYEPLQQEKLDDMQKEAIFKSSSKRVRPFEYVGFEKILNKTSQHEILQVIGLSNKTVRGGDSSLVQLCPSLLELDLSINLLSSWEDLASITKHLPQLNILNISNNRLSRNCDESLSVSFSQVEHLVAGRMNWDCDDLVQAAKLFPNLVSLQVPDNMLSQLDESFCLNLFKLEELDLDNNPLKSWDEVLKISNMKKLEILHLNNTELTNIHFKTVEDPFPSLKILYLSSNKINDWSSVSALDKVTHIEQLYFKDNPLLNAENFETNRQIIICRIHNLKKLDKIVITEEERRGASLDYLKKYGTMYLESKNQPEREVQFQVEHPCYVRLVKKYGAPEAAELSVSVPKLKNLLISLSISCPQSGPQIVKKKVPKTMKVQKLRGMLQKLFSTGSTFLNISYRSQDNQSINYVFDNDLKDLSYYSIENGDEIIVSW